MPTFDWERHGLPGIMIGALCLILWQVLKFVYLLIQDQNHRSQTDMDRILAQFEQKRKDFMQQAESLEAAFSSAVQKQYELFMQVITKVENRWEESTRAICDSIGRLEDRLDSKTIKKRRIREQDQSSQSV